MSAKTPRIWGTYVEDPHHPASRIPLDTPAWFRWLAAPTTSRFTYPVFDPRVGYIVGFMTVRKEGRQRGGNSWTVYRRHAGRVRKVYVGRARAVTTARLAEIARTFLDREGLRAGDEASAFSSY